MMSAILAIAGLALQPVAVAPAVEKLRCPLNAPYDPQNPFARVLRGEASLPEFPPATGVIERSPVLIAVPIDWTHPGHTLVIPRRAVRSLLDMTQQEVTEVYAAIRRVATAQQRALGATGFTVAQNNGRNQHVCHVHFHVIPNTPEAKVERATPQQMNEMAAKLRAALPIRTR